MADPETLAALKRAYADIILNTTKEAAARVMFSEKKARCYQKELVTVRDEAVNMLLRLKLMYDSKVKETEMMSLKQQQKVEELEAQLGEAEDIVGELRMELRVLRDELKKVINGQTYLKSDSQEDSCLRNSDTAVSVMPEVSSSHERLGAVGSFIPVKQSGVVANGITNPSSNRLNSIKRCSSKDNMDLCHYTLPSILTKRREVMDRSMTNGDLSSNGCADATGSISSVRDGEGPVVSQNTSQKDCGTPIPLKTSPVEHEHSRKSVISETEALKSPLCEESPVLAVTKDRCIMYTFKRKRKKEALSNLEGDSSSEEIKNMKQKTGEKDDGYLESLKPSFTGESSRDSLCMAKVARQLVPFSKKIVNQ